MKFHNQFNNNEERSDEVREILGKAPRWVIEWGITVILATLTIIILSASIISYNDIVSARILMTTKIPPSHVRVRAHGRLTHVFVGANQRVREEENLAVIENSANYQDVQLLVNKIESFKLDSNFSFDLVSARFPSNLVLGSIQSEYNNFVKQLQTYLLHQELKPEEKEIEALSQQIDQLQSLLNNQQTQLDLYTEELTYSSKSFERSKKLHDEKVISDLDFEIASKTILSDRQRYEVLRSAVSNSLVSISALKSAKIKLVIRRVELTDSYRQQVEGAIERVKLAIRDWTQLYVLKSPINGTVTLFDVWIRHQNVELGQTLFSVIPLDADSLLGKLTIPIQNSGKIKLGNRVIIKLDNYPYHEWGSISGRISQISSVPKQGEQTYTAYVSIRSLATSFGKKIEFKQEMQGNAEIITEELTVLQRVFYQLRKIFERKV
jgi:multidrug resistance efflux pump